MSPRDDVAELGIAEHGIEIGLRVIGDHCVANSDVVGRHSVVDVEFGDLQPVAHCHHRIEEAAPGSFRFADDVGDGQRLEQADVRLDAQRIDGRAPLAEAFEQLEHAGDMGLVLGTALPAHIVVVDQLRVRGLGLGGVEHQVEHRFAAHRAGKDGVADCAGFRLNRLVDDVV